jgi:peptidoglycan hydrolase CwlO-like protein
MSSHQLENRALKAKVDSLNKHIDVLDVQVAELKKTVRRANEIIEDYLQKIIKLEGFVTFANEYYPGCIQQYHVIDRLEGPKI